MDRKMRFAYADPPYLGCASLYKDKHQDWAWYDKKRAHKDLIVSLWDNYPDGWAMSCSSTSLQTILGLFNGCPIRVGAWVKPFAVFKPNVGVAYAWEPVIFSGGRKRTREEDTVRDWVSANITMQTGMPGAKPRAFCRWIFSILNIKRGDEFVDLFPGSGAVANAFAEWIGEQPELPPLPLEYVMARRG